MNYFAHGRGLADRPYALAGSALPDWLSASDRRARIVAERLDGGEIAAGVRRHLADDARFHVSAAFRDVSGRVTRWLRARDRAARASFFGHVMTELLLDAALIAPDPGRLDLYYAALDRVRVAAVLERARLWTRAPVARLGRYVDLFRERRFLYGYLDDDGLCARLDGVAWRAGLRLPDGLAAVVPEARRLVYARAGDLLCAS